MRVSCTRSALGSTYRIYRGDDDFAAQLKQLMPFLRADQDDVLIGSPEREPGVVLTIGPLSADQDAVFRPCIAAYLDR